MHESPDIAVVWTEVKALRHLYENLRVADQRALDLMTTELARRLEALNHAHAQALEQNATFMPRDMFYTTLERVNEKVSALARLVYIGVGIVLVLNALMSVAWIVFHTRSP